MSIALALWAAPTTAAPPAVASPAGALPPDAPPAAVSPASAPSTDAPHTTPSGATAPASPAPIPPAPVPAAPAAPKASGNSADTSHAPGPSAVFVPPVLTRQDSLFLIAATGEPRFQPIRDSAEKLLVAADTATLDYLLSRRLAGQTPRQRHYVETLFKAISDSGRHPRAAAKLDAALETVPDSLKAQLLHIGSELGDSAFLRSARRYLAHDSEEVRRNSVRSLGSYPSPANAAWLIAGLEKTRDLERAERLWALGKQKDFKDWPKVLPVLKDSNLYNRELARRIVAHACGDWANVEKLAPSELDDDELLEWVLMADESPGIAAKLWVRKHVPMLSPARMRFIGSALRLQ